MAAGGRGLAFVALVLSAAVLAGCASSSHVTAPSHSRTFKPHVCAPAVATQRDLSQVRTTMLPITGSPFGVVNTSDGRWSFVSQAAGQIAVLADAGLRPHVVREIPLPGPSPAGETVSHDGRLLMVADGSGAAVISVARAERGSSQPVLGQLAAVSGTGDLQLDSAIEVVTSPDDRFAFVSLEYAGKIAVFNLRAALRTGFRRRSLVGMIPLGQAVVGMALSPDGRWLYATSELAAGARSSSRQTGTISVIDVNQAESHPARSAVASARAGCGTVRTAVSPDGRIVWVTARESNALLGFSASRLRRDPQHALIADVRVGEAPIGLALLDHGTRVVVADSNRFETPGATSGLTVVDARAALAGKPAVLGVIPSGKFPRELSVEGAQATMLVTNFASNQLEAVDTAKLP